MIILPDRNIARAKYLMPMLYRDWRKPLSWEGKDTSNVLGIYFLVQAWRADKRVVWTGRFEDREDADEFLYAIATGSLLKDKYIQRLVQPMPWSGYRESDFDPAMLYDETIHYNMVTQIGIGASSGVWTAPGDCYGLRDRAGEIADVISGGGGGGSGSGGYSAAGGGGGGFARITSYGMSPGQQFSYGIAGGAAGGTGDGYSAYAANGASAGASWFISGGVLAANGGGAGNATTQTTTGGGGGAGYAGAWGKTGGRGGYTTAYPYSGGGGGGGASGPNGDGWNGGDSAANYAQTNGGSGNGNQIGGGGPSADGAAGNWYGPWGPGGGGGGQRIISSAPNGQYYAGSGGHYGGGGAGQAMPAGQPGSRGYGGSGGSGILVIQYESTPTVVVSSISPASGPTGGGQAVAVSGSGFANISSANIGGAPITGISYNANTLYGTTSPGGAGTYNAYVYGPYSTGVGGSYTYVTPPSVSSAVPASGPTGGGNYVRVYGANMSGATAIYFNGVPGTSLSNVDANSVQCYAPAGAAGACSIAVYNGYGSGAATVYTFVTPPSVSYVTPASGPTTPNNAVLAVITGANMDGVNSVTFGGVAASPIAVINSTTVHAWVPAHAAGLVNVVVTNGYGSGNANAYTYVVPPSLSACNPVLGLTHGGMAVTLTGANLSGVTSVTFGGTAATSVVVVNANTITCITPAHARGLVDIVATNTYGSGVLANGFTYLLPAAGFNMPMMGI